MLRVVIADDQAIIRDGIKLIIEQDSEIKVVGSAVNGREAFELCSSLLPDLVLMDMVMPFHDGIEGTRLIKEKYKQVKVVILTTYIEEGKISDALRNGADGYVFKDMESDELILSIKSIAKGLKVMHENAYCAVLKQMSISHNINNNQEDVLNYNLTERELEIIKLIVYGKSYKEVSSSLFLSEGSVRNAVSAILTKLNLKDRVQLAVFAVKNNIV